MRRTEKKKTQGEKKTGAVNAKSLKLLDITSFPAIGQIAAMEGGELSTGSMPNDCATITTSMIIERLATFSLNAAAAADIVPTVQPRKLEKDPRKIARK